MWDGWWRQLWEGWDFTRHQRPPDWLQCILLGKTQRGSKKAIQYSGLRETRLDKTGEIVVRGGNSKTGTDSMQRHLSCQDPLDLFLRQGVMCWIFLWDTHLFPLVTYGSWDFPPSRMFFLSCLYSSWTLLSLLRKTSLGPPGLNCINTPFLLRIRFFHKALNQKIITLWSPFWSDSDLLRAESQTISHNIPWISGLQWHQIYKHQRNTRIRLIIWTSAFCMKWKNGGWW